MASQDLIDALESVQQQIKSLAAEKQRVTDWTAEGVSVRRKRMTELLAEEEALRAAVRRGQGPVEIISTRVPL